MRDYTKNLGKYAQKGVKRTHPISEGTRRKMSLARMGVKPWNTGKKWDEKTKKKIGLKSKERGISKLARQKAIEASMGAKNKSWKGGITLNPNYNSFMVRKRRLRKLNAIGSHTIKEWENLKRFYKNMCLCCKRSEPDIKLTEDHIIPLTRGGTDYIDNIQPLCQSCNSKKNIKTIDFIQNMHSQERTVN